MQLWTFVGWERGKAKCWAYFGGQTATYCGCCWTYGGGGCAVGAALLVDVLAPVIKHDSFWQAQNLKMLTHCRRSMLDDICACFNLHHSLSIPASFSGWWGSAELNWQRCMLLRSQICQRTRSRSQALPWISAGEGWWYQEHDFYLTFLNLVAGKDKIWKLIFISAKAPSEFFSHDTHATRTWLCLKWKIKVLCSAICSSTGIN